MILKPDEYLGPRNAEEWIAAIVVAGYLIMKLGMWAVAVA